MSSDTVEKILGACILIFILLCIYLGYVFLNISYEAEDAAIEQEQKISTEHIEESI